MIDIKHPSKWILTPAQTRVLDAVVQHGCHKSAAAALQVSVKTIEGHLANLRTANKFSFMVRSLHMFIAWHQYRTSKMTPSNSTLTVSTQNVGASSLKHSYTSVGR